MRRKGYKFANSPCVADSLGHSLRQFKKKKKERTRSGQGEKEIRNISEERSFGFC